MELKLLRNLSNLAKVAYKRVAYFKKNRVSNYNSQNLMWMGVNSVTLKQKLIMNIENRKSEKSNKSCLQRGKTFRNPLMNN